MGYITERQRIIIETMLKDGRNVKEIASTIGKHYTTVYREIKKGTIYLRDGKTWLDKPVYCADAGQRIMKERAHNKGVAYKVNNLSFLDRAAYYIKECRYSPYATLVKLREEFPGVTICKTTLYNYIYKERLFISRADLPYSKDGSVTSPDARKQSYRLKGAKSIEERPKSVYGRNLFGDWEMDTVVGAQGKGTSCLLVLTERTCRKEIIRKMPDRKAQTVVDMIDTLEKEIGAENFKRIFRTITCDNGTEFSAYKDIERSVNGGKRTNLYFCHPYCSGERGSNENNNKFIRRFIPKGISMDDLMEEFVKHIENWMNNYPRRMFNGLSANQFYALATLP